MCIRPLLVSLQTKAIMDSLPPILSQDLACEMNRSLFSKVIDNLWYDASSRAEACWGVHARSLESSGIQKDACACYRPLVHTMMRGHHVPLKLQAWVADETRGGWREKVTMQTDESERGSERERARAGARARGGEKQGGHGVFD
jgi:hypothetical protein